MENKENKENKKQNNRKSENPKKYIWDTVQMAKQFTKNIEKQDIIRGAFLNALLIHVAPGGEITAHYEDYDALFFIIEGTGSILIGSEMIHVNPGMMIFSPKEKLRGIFPEKSLLILGLQEPH